jgi:hypothetical protein
MTPENWRSVLETTAMRVTVIMAQRQERVEPILKVLRLVSSAKDTLAFAASFEPHAAIAWSGMSVLLPVSR